MPRRRVPKSQPLLTKAVELSMAVPQVVAHRVTRMAIAGPNLSERDRREFQRMGEEKAAAFAESWNAMAVQAMRANQTLATSFMRSFWSATFNSGRSVGVSATDFHNAALGVLDRGMAPLHRRAVANAKRLARTKLR